MPIQFRDPYKQMLQDQAKALIAREADVAAREVQLQAEKEAIAQDRERLEIARQHYEAFLASQHRPMESSPVRLAECGGESGPDLIPPPEEIEAGPDKIPLPTRMGPKRRRVLEEVATATNGLTTREISDRTTVNIDVVRNIVAAEIKDGIFIRHGDRVIMTAAGLDYLNRASAKFGPAQKDAPPTAASGVFQ